MTETARFHPTPAAVQAAPFGVSVLGGFGFVSESEIRISGFRFGNLAPFRCRLRIGE
jgi:hypothetical protein